MERDGLVLAHRDRPDGRPRAAAPDRAHGRHGEIADRETDLAGRGIGRFGANLDEAVVFGGP